MRLESRYKVLLNDRQLDTYQKSLVPTSEKKTKHANPSQQIGIYSYLVPQIKLNIMYTYKGGTRIST